MIQILATYLIVALAFAWVSWSVLLPRRQRARVRALVRPGKRPNCDGGCPRCD
jgi:hypothetical protein